MMAKKTQERIDVEREVLSRGKMSDALDNAFADDIRNILYEWERADPSMTDLRMLAYLGYSGGWAAGIAHERQKVR